MPIHADAWCLSAFPYPCVFLSPMKYSCSYNKIEIRTHQQLNVIIMSNSNVQTTDLFPSRDETYSMRVAAIEKQLNNRCCLHDSLMPLLEFNTFQSSMYRWENNLKNLNKKINDYQYHINGLLVQNIKQPSTQYNPPDFSKTSGINKVKKSIQQLKQILNKAHKIQPQFNPNKYFDQGNDQLESYSRSQRHNNQFWNLKQSSKQSIKQLRKYVQMSLALFRNELMLNQISESSRLENSRSLSQFSNGQEEIVKSIQKTMFHQLRKQLQTIRNGASNFDLQSFHLFTTARLSGDLMQINQIVQLLYPSDPSIILSESEVGQVIQQLQTSQQKMKLIDWQIRGLKKKYLSELNYKYLHENEPFEVSILEKKMVRDINALDNAHIELKNKVQYLKQDLLKK